MRARSSTAVLNDVADPFIPLTLAATIGMLFPEIRTRFPWVGLSFLVLVLAMFGYMVSENSTYYQVTSKGWIEAATYWNATQFWTKFQIGQAYCAVNMQPIGILLTGPTMSEYTIIDRSKASLCPAGIPIVTYNGIQAPLP